MATSGRHIFRNKAIQHYRLGREKDILPRFVAPRIFLFLWILLGLLFASAVLSWLEQVPTKIAGSGVVLDQSEVLNRGSGAVAAIFLPTTALNKVHVGQLVEVQLGLGNPFDAVVLAVVSGVKSPHEVQQHYGQAIAEPAVVAMIGFGPKFLTQEYAGALIQAQVQVGTQRMLSLLPGVGQWIGAE